MSSLELNFKIPSPMAEELKSVNQQFLVDIFERGLHDFKIERALTRYGAGGISFGAAAQEIGISESDFARHAYAKGIEPPFSEETLQEELL